MEVTAPDLSSITAITSNRTSPCRPPPERYCAARARILLAFCGVTDSSGSPNSVLVRAFTSAKTVRAPRRATTSISPARTLQLRSTISNPSSMRKAHAASSPARPSALRSGLIFGLPQWDFLGVWRHAVEREPVHLAGSQLAQGFHVLFGPVAFVVLEVVAREAGVQRAHHAVPFDLGDDARRGDRVEYLVGVRDPVGRESESGEREVVQYRPVAVGGDVRERIGEGLQVDHLQAPAVDERSVDGHDGDVLRRGAELEVQLLAALGAEQFRVVHALDLHPGVEDDRGRVQRARERAATRLVRTADEDCAVLAEKVFVR